MLQTTTLQFLTDLKINNNKSWLDAHRKAYEAAKEDYTLFIQNVIDSFATTDPALAHLKAKDCLFRINRDVRFSKDKSPYKTNFGAYLNALGKKSETAGYYIHLEPGHSFVGGGMWQPLPVQLQKMRQEIDYNLPDFKTIITSPKFKKVYGGLAAQKGQVLSRVPKGYDAANPAAEYLIHKSYVATTPVPDAVLTQKKLLPTTIQALQVLQPFILFLNQAIA